MPTLLESIRTRLAYLRSGESFGIERKDGAVVFVDAHDFIIDCDGRLIFYLAGKRVAAYIAADWVRVMRGLVPDDLRQGGTQ